MMKKMNMTKKRIKMLAMYIRETKKQNPKKLLTKHTILKQKVRMIVNNKMKKRAQTIQKMKNLKMNLMKIKTQIDIIKMEIREV